MNFLERNIECVVCKSESIFFCEKDSYRHFKCGNKKCALIFVYPSPLDLNSIYNLEVIEDSKKMNRIVSVPTVKNTLSIELAQALISHNDKWHTLDVGCRNGNFILGIKDICSVVIGIEPNSSAANYCKQIGLNVRNEFFSARTLQYQGFNLINMSDVIEHVPYPQTMVKDAMSLLSNNGYIIIRTPNLASFWSRSTFLVYKCFGVPWSSLTPPEHLSNFSLNGLVNLLRDHGLFIDSVYNESPSLYYEVGQLHLLSDLRKSPSLHNFLRLFIGYTSYTLIFILNKMLKPFFKSDFSQTIVAKKIS
jgi:SAM-dependent methyltransferase